MDTTIAVAIVSGLCVAIPSLVATIVSNKNANNLVVYRLTALEEKVNKHNNLVERMAVVERDLKTAFHLIDDLEKK